MTRKTADGALYHTYKITRDRGVLFYRSIDRLAYYTLQSVMSRKHHLSILASSLMFTHIHEATVPEDIVQLSSYEHDLSTTFARAYNRATGRSGPLFSPLYGSAPKRKEKDRRSCLIYVWNNPVEKKLVRRADEDRWTFLAYYEREYPFSSKPIIRQSRKDLVDAIHLAEHEYKSGRPLSFPLLFQLFSKLTAPEQEQLTDFIIQRYFYFNRQACYELFGSYDNMVKATEISRGADFDINEEFDPYSDVPYREMCKITAGYGLLDQGMPLFHLPESRLDRLSAYLRSRTNASNSQVSRFLHKSSE